MLNFSLRMMKRGVIFFWALWLTIVFLTNFFESLKAMGIIGEGWTFASGNYGFMQFVTEVHNTPAFIVTILFAGVVIWQAVGAFLFWRAWAAFQGIPEGLAEVDTAFTFSIALWAAFMIADEIFLAYDVQGTHMAIFMAQLITLLAIRLLPDS